jgi:outer membrane protein insertion porin family
MSFLSKISLFVCFVGFSFGNYLQAQEIPSTPEVPEVSPESDLPKQYEVKSVRVSGFVISDSAAILNFSGLKAGKNITIPGDELRVAIRQIWKQNLFEDVRIDIDKIVGDGIYLEVVVKEEPRLSGYGFKGVPKGQVDDLKNIVGRYAVKGRKADANMRKNIIAGIKDFYEDKGFPNVGINIVIKDAPEVYGKGYVQYIIEIKKNGRLRISDIVFTGNQSVKSSRLRRLMKDTKQRRWYTFFKSSKYVLKDYEKDKQKIVDYYHARGLRDMEITSDSVFVVENAKGKKSLRVEMKIAEQKIYYFGNIDFRGNTTYTTAELSQQLGIKKGDIFNMELLQSRISYDKNGRDISTLYMDNGHLFFRADPIEKGIREDSVDIEIRISEGPVARIDKVTIKGNDRTHEHVIRRELRTLPGAKFSRSDIIRSQRELMSLNYFNPEKMGINTPVNPQRGTVDVEYEVEERPSDQLELSAGWGGAGRGVVGTLGVTFNNFSLRNLFNAESWSPLPQGDGQRLSIRAQSNGRYFQSYNFSFSEPWLGGRRPMGLSVSAFHNRQNNGQTPESSNYQAFIMTGGSVGIGTRLRFPDDFFWLQASIDYQNLNLANWSSGSTFIVNTGSFHNLALNLNLSRNSIDNPTFPQTGAMIQLSGKFTLPYSLFKSESEQARYATMSLAERYKMVEYFKLDLKTEWYMPLAKNFVFKMSAKGGFLGMYNSKVGLSPFERYELGGDGISNMIGLQGRNIISMRGYKVPTSDVSPLNQNGAAMYNKYTAELRYLISPNPSAMFYVTLFGQAGNVWNSFKDYNPFQLKRSVGVGLRAFLPMFGTVGFDYGIGFDKNLPTAKNMFDYGSFNIVIGFEPE